MQEGKRSFKEKLKNLIPKNRSKKIILLIIMILIIASCVITATVQIVRYVQKKAMEDKPLLEYEIKQKIDNKYKILIKVNHVEGIEKIKYIDSYSNNEIELNCNGKFTVGIDYLAEDQTSYEFKITPVGKSEITEILYFEIPRIQGNYTLNKETYVYEPDLSGYNDKYTRYLNVDENGNLIPGNWIDSDKPNNWYHYGESQWANIYVETEGMETYYVWIPRYCFKLNQETQRSDVKFIDVYNNYKDENGNVTLWKDLESQGYQVPEAFRFGYKEIPGYWAMKYTAGDTNNLTVTFETVANKTKIKVSSIKTTTSVEIAKYTYSINGVSLKESTTPDDFEYEMNTENVNYVNVTALDINGEIIGSMTKTTKQAKVNPPELREFKQDTTFYVTYDENGNEHSTIPISQTEPNDWYDYGDRKWANIVTRNNGLETYYTWIPRYEFRLDQISQRSNVNFLEGTSQDVSFGYQIPEAFTFNGKELTGYWVMKYTVGNEAAPIFNTEVMATNSTIKTKGMLGTKVEEGQIYNYYLNGEYKGQKTVVADYFEYTGLSSNTDYIVHIEIRDSTTDEYLGSVTKEVRTTEANPPNLTGFNEDCTYYVLYDEDGNETIGDKIRNNGNNMPNNWYDYSSSKWANIVVKGNGTETYYTWIPRYQFMITSSQQVQPQIGRTEVKFVQGTSKETDVNYQIPEAFTFNGKELTGYWAMKYTVGE